MIMMKDILVLAETNNGMLTTKMLENGGILRGSIKYLVDRGDLERVSRGFYVLPGIFEDEFVVVQNRFKKGMYSLETALFLHGLTDRTPNKMTMSFPQGYNMSQAKLSGIRCLGLKKEFYDLGIEEITTPSGNKVWSYSKEKTLADILRPINRVDIQVISSAFKSYVSQKEKNIPLLSKYAKLLGVEDKLKSYLEVLL